MRKITQLFLFLSITFTQIVVGQLKTVTGTVTDESGPLPGVSVILKNTTKGAETDFDGNYTLKAKKGDVLIFSFVGMKTVEKTISSSNVYNVLMEFDSEMIEEVIVTGITKTDKRLFTGATTRLKAEDIKLSGVPDISRALEGRAAGVSVQNVSGTFGAAPKIRVRGATSILGNSKPLWVVDGVIMEDVVQLGADDLASGDPVTLISSAISGLNAEDVESFEVLKDGSATSIYGARAMAGVIVITTKRGKSGMSSFNYTNEGTFRFTPSYNNFNIMDSQEQMSVYEELRGAGWLNYSDVTNNRNGGVYTKMYQLLNQLDGNGNFVLENTPEAKAAYLRKAEYRNTNWFKHLFQNNVMQNHSISMSSGTEKATYYASLSALVDPGWTLASNVNRFTANFNTSYKLSDKFKLNVFSNASYRKQKAPGSLSQQTDVVSGKVSRNFDINPFSYALNTSRTLDHQDYYTRDYAPFNIFHELKNNYMDFNVANVRIQTDINYKFNSKVDLTLLGALKYQNSNIDHHMTEFSNLANAYRAMGTAVIRKNNPLLYTDPSDQFAVPVSVLPQGGVYQRKNYNMLSYDFRATASYKDIINEDHTVNIYTGMEFNKTNRNYNKFTGWGIQYAYGETPFYTTDFFKRGVEDNDFYYNIRNTRQRNVAFFGNATYSWKRRYTINGTFRYEGTNRLGKSRSARWLPTWNVSGSWNVDQEKFFEHLNPLSHLTLKGSYSLTADSGPAWVTNSLVDIQSGTPWRPFQSVRENALYIKSLENSELTYEKKKELNLGIDLGFFNDRVNLVADWYKRDNYDLIGPTITQGIGGEIVKYGNVAAMKSSGFELALNTTNIKTKDFSWNTSFVYSKTNNEVTKLDNYLRTIDLVKGGNSAARVGYPAGALFSIPFKGLNDQGVPMFLDQNGNTSTSDVYFQEREKIDFLEYSGTVNPTDVGSLGNVFKYKGLTFNVFLTYSFGNVVRLNPVFSSKYSDLAATPREFKNRWVVPGDENQTDIPVIATTRMLFNDRLLGVAYNAYNYSTARIAKGDFIRMKEISLGYDFNQDLVENLNLKKLSLKLQFTNPFLLYSDKKLNGQDPEFYNSGGVANPIAKQLTLTLKVGI